MNKVEKKYYLINFIAIIVFIISLINILNYLFPDISIKNSTYKPTVYSSIFKSIYFFISNLIVLYFTFYLLASLGGSSKKKEDINDITERKGIYIKSQLIKGIFSLIFISTIFNVIFIVWRFYTPLALPFFISNLIIFYFIFYLLASLGGPSKKKEAINKIIERKGIYIKSQLIKGAFSLIFISAIFNVIFIVWRLNNIPPHIFCLDCVQPSFYWNFMKNTWIGELTINVIMLVISFFSLSLLRINSKLNEKISDIPYRIISYK